MEKKITIIGAQEHNLQNLSCVFPKNKLVVFTGVSGSGKSSLAFHTLYAEGKRRYIESLSTYARQFLGGNTKPKVTKITGLTPAIAINQKTISYNTRSTVGTTTEIFDYLRLLFARIGQAYCLNGHGPVTSLSISQMINKIYDLFKKKSKIMILAPCARDQKGSFKELFLTLQKQHFLRVFVDGEIRSLDERILLDKNQRHNIDLLVDQLEIKNNPTVQSRLYDAVEVALKYGQQLVRIVDANLLEKGVLFSAVHACAYCGFRITNLEPRLFSFNAPLGACARCKGIGSCVSADWSKIVPDSQLSISKGAIAFFPDPKFAAQNIDWQRFQALLEHYNIPQDTPVKKLTKKQQKIIMLGSEEPITVRLYASSGSMVEKTTILEGVGTLIERRYHETFSPGRKKNYYRFLSTVTCEECAGNRLKPEVLTVKIAQLSIIEVTHLTIKQALT